MLTLNTSYKAFTGTLTSMLWRHVEEKQLLPPKQKALRKGRRGCLDALVIDAAVAEETKLDGRDMSVGWIDYQKAFDSVPHQWLLRVLKAVRAPREVRRAVKWLIPLWKTDLAVKTADGMAMIPVDLKRGLFQGPLLFCLCVTPASHKLRKGQG